MRGRLSDNIFEKSALLIALTSIVFLFLIFLFLFSESYKLFEFISPLDLLTSDWRPTSEKPSYGILSLVAGSLAVTVGALLIAIPLGIATAIFLSEIAPSWLGELLKPVIEILAGIPSVVIGFFALVAIAPLISQTFGIGSGLTLLNGIVVLALMVLPTIESISEDAIRSVPKKYREASLALGATKWQTIHTVVVPAAFSGINVAILLGFGRAIGETMVVLMATGNVALVPAGLLDPIRTLTATIAAETGEVARGTPHYYSLFALGTSLFLITFVINYIGDSLFKRGKK